MDNRNAQQNKNTVSFEKLKKLSQMLNGSELGSFATGISKAKKALDTYCKSLKEKECECV